MLLGLHVINVINGKKKKKWKTKTTFSFEQLLELKRRYQQKSYLDPSEQVELAASLGLSEFQVYIPFVSLIDIHALLVPVTREAKRHLVNKNLNF